MPKSTLRLRLLFCIFLLIYPVAKINLYYTNISDNWFHSFKQSIPGSNYYVEDEFNLYANKIKPKFSIFHLNIKSLNCHHKELNTSIHILNLSFDCICISEVWSTNLNSYQSILKDYTSFFAETILKDYTSFFVEITNKSGE